MDASGAATPDDAITGAARSVPVVDASGAATPDDAITSTYDDGMRRVQIQFTEEQHERLRERAARDGRSIAAVVRDAVDDLLEEDERAEALRRAVEAIRQLDVRGGARSGFPDIAERHDDYLAEDYLKSTFLKSTFVDTPAL